MCFFRKKYLDSVIKNPNTFNYVDIAIPLQLAELGFDRFAYVSDVGMYHYRDGLKRELFRLKRDVAITYLPVVGKRKFNYINFESPKDVLKLLGWIVWVNLIIPSFVIGIYKSIKYKDWACIYELPTNFILTNYTIILFLINPTGRKLILKSISSLLG